MREADIQLLDLITRYTTLRQKAPDTVTFKEPLEFIWGPDSQIFKFGAINSEAGGYMQLLDGNWKLSHNSEFTYVLTAIKAEAFSYIKEVLQKRIKQLEIMMPSEVHSDCRSYDGVTVGLVDSIICMARVLRHRDLNCTVVKEALKDFHADEDIKYLLDTASKA